MHCLYHWKTIVVKTLIQNQGEIVLHKNRCKVLNRNIFRTLFITTHVHEKESIAKALCNVKPKSKHNTVQHFVDIKQVRTIGGNGGDGQISFLQLWINDRAGPDGGNGGNGGHVIFEAKTDVKDLNHVESVIRAEDGEKGYNKNCFGKNAEHNVVYVPVGTIVRSIDGRIFCDLDKPGMIFIAARGGAGGHGNVYFKSSVQQSPEICEYGATGENLEYVLEIRSMAHIGLPV